MLGYIEVELTSSRLRERGTCANATRVGLAYVLEVDAIHVMNAEGIRGICDETGF